MKNSEKIRKKFDGLYAQWEEVILDPRIRFSSKPQDYIDNEPYREIVKLGEDVLPFVLEKIEQDVFFMNQAALEIAGLQFDNIVEQEVKKSPKERLDFLVKEIPQFLSEKQKSKLILKYIR